MFDSTFFRFLVAFVLIIGLSFLVMHFVGGTDNNVATNANTQKASAQ